MKQIALLILLVKSLSLTSQNYFYERDDVSPLNLLTTNENFLLFWHYLNKKVYKLNYKSQVIDSLELNSKIAAAKFKGNDSIVLIGYHNQNNNNPYLYDSISYILIDTNLNILKEAFLPYQIFYLYHNILLYKDRIIFVGESSTNNHNFLYSLNYNGVLINSRFEEGNINFILDASDSTFYFAIAKSNGLQLMKLDTSLNLISTGTIPKFPSDDATKAENYKNNVIVLGIYTKVFPNLTVKYYIGIGRYDKNFDTTYYFNYFNSDFYDPYIYPIGLTVSKNHIYSSNYLRLDIFNTTGCKDTICITCYDSTLNIKWQKFFGGDHNYHVVKIFPAPDGGCIFSMSIRDLIQGTFDGVIVWLDSLGNNVLTFPKNTLSFNEINIYPNPGSNELNVLIPINFKTTTFELYNSVGMLCKQEQFRSHHIRVITNELKSGLYFYRLLQGNEVVSQGKWIKE